MNDDFQKLVDRVKQYFCIEEFVDKIVFDKFGESAWKFIDESILESVLVVREGLGKPMRINNWKWGGQFSQRGLRHNMSSLVKKKTSLYLSAHMFGKAVDFDVKGMNSVDVRDWIAGNPQLFKHKIRLERNMHKIPISWVHLDTMSDATLPHVYLFDV